ncbi:MAG: TIGR02757 family protein [Spirosomaceae bacterium]|nr:TIGR02757 family protein [Spirosomataceae bacterium]
MPQSTVDLLNEKYEQFNKPDFIPDDPVSIPHRFSLKQDIEISGFFAAVLAWGQRKTIINKCTQLMEMMDNAPYQFITQHTESDLRRFLDFKHRTFNATDTLYFIEFFREHYAKSNTLETAFTKTLSPEAENIKSSLVGFHNHFFSLPEFPQRTRKHVATPVRNSSCKRINMYLRWMVRKDNKGVDFGIWQQIKPSQLICPCDVHVERVARHLGMFNRPKPDWQAAEELTNHLKLLDPHDPVKYDFALFGLGIEQYFLLLPRNLANKTKEKKH